MFVNYKGSYFFWIEAGRGKLEALDGEKGNILFYNERRAWYELILGWKREVLDDKGWIMNAELGMNWFLNERKARGT